MKWVLVLGAALLCSCNSPTVPAPPVDSLPDCHDAPAAPRQLRRLSGYEYTATLQDLFHSDDLPAPTFFVDDAADGFDNDSTQLTVSGALPLELLYHSEKVADFAVRHLDRFMPCNEPSASCGQAFIASVGRRAWRRPLTAAEQDAMGQLFADALPNGFAAAVHVVLRAMLMYPDFLYRLELGTLNTAQRYTLSPFEIATELSYLITGSTPDDELLDAAAHGKLATPEQLETQAQRLWRTPRAATAMLHFFDQWLELGTIMTVPKDPRSATLSPPIRQAMLEETHRLILDVWQRGGTLADLLTAQQTYLNDTLAQFYGRGTASDGNFVRVPTANAVGILGQGSITAGQAMPAMSSPVRRGYLVRTRLLCQVVPPPPPTVPALLPATGELHTTRQVFSRHSLDPTCVGCHELMDPIGFAFESYDAFGRQRTQEKGYKIDTSGQIIDGAPGAPPMAFADLPELASHLATHPTTAQCLANMIATYAFAQEQIGGGNCASIQLGNTAHGTSLMAQFAAVMRLRDFFERTN